MFRIRQKNAIKKRQRRPRHYTQNEIKPINALLSTPASTLMPPIDELNKLYNCRTSQTQISTYYVPTKLILKPSLPMLAKPIEPKSINFTSNYVYEEKFDGERMLATIIANGTTQLYSRRLTLSNIFRYNIELTRDTINCIVDGELIYLDGNGKIVPICDTGVRSGCKIQYRIFDIQWLNGSNVMGRPLIERKELLSRTIVPSETVKLVDFHECINLEYTMSAFNLITASGGEGLILKLKNEPYIANTRKWIKLKSLHINRHKDEYELFAYRFICDKNGIRSILECGYFDDNGTFVHVTNVSSGINAEKRTQLNLLADSVTGIFNRRLVVTLHADKITAVNRSLRHPCLYRIRYDIATINYAIFK